jgi:hypothetical protein
MKISSRLTLAFGKPPLACVSLTAMALLLAAMPVRAHWPNTNATKYVQFPDQSQMGLDVWMAQPLILADDFPCTNTGPITDIHLWTSWLNDQPMPNTTFTLSIWSDAPAGPVPFSQPSQMLWSETFGPGSYEFRFWTNSQESFWNPDGDIMGSDTKIWQYNFYPTKPFIQTGTLQKPIVYWLSATTSPNLNVGWKTSTNHWNDRAVYGHGLTAVPDWKPLNDPRTQVPLDLSFALTTTQTPTNPPPTNPPVQIKFLQNPDRTTNGLDVRATARDILADDFKCRLPKPIRGVTVWGSWLDDMVDTNVIFRLGLWTDVPATQQSRSHPGGLICTETFYPPGLLGTAPLRYQYRLDADKLFETFFDPDFGVQGFVGTDTQIWRYDFYPQLPCWREYGTPFRPLVYWLSVTALIADTNKYQFGWKTSTNHWNDDGVYGHLDVQGNPLKDWKELINPRDNKSLDLSFRITTFPVVGINKDLKNITGQPADCLEIVLAGSQIITWHYDDSPPWPNFTVTQVGGNTVLRWCGKGVLNNAITHVGFMMPGTAVKILSMKWYANGVFTGVPIQVNHHLLGAAGGGAAQLMLANDFVPNPVFVLGGEAEFFTDPAPLDQMNPGAVRNPIKTVQLPLAGPVEIPPGGAMTLVVPPGPPEAEYVLFVLRLGDAAGNLVTQDFVELPLDTALRPIILDVQVVRDTATITWDAMAGRTYRLQHKNSIDAPLAIWMDEPGDVLATDEIASKSVPIGGTQRYYRVVLLP